MDQRQQPIDAYREFHAHVRQRWHAETWTLEYIGAVLFIIGGSGVVVQALARFVSFLSFTHRLEPWLLVGSTLILVGGMVLLWASTSVLTSALRHRLIEDAITFLQQRAYDDPTLEEVAEQAVRVWSDPRYPDFIRARNAIMVDALKQVRPAPTVDAGQPAAHTTACPHCGTLITLTPAGSNR